jgi:hypothetical protein
MKNTLILILLAILIMPMAYCQTKRKAKKSNDLAKVKELIGSTAVINFASYGSGIDADTYGKLKEYLAKNQIKFSEKPKGREGEVEVSIDYSSKSEDERKKITQYLKSLHNPEKLVNVEIK